MPVIFAVSLVVLSACVILLHLRKFRTGLLSDIGAVAALMSVFWGLGLFSGGYIYTPGGNALALSTERSLTLEPELLDKNIVFSVVCESYGEVRKSSTGLTRNTNMCRQASMITASLTRSSSLTGWRA